jgi:hypothetical protein
MRDSIRRAGWRSFALVLFLAASPTYAAAQLCPPGGQTPMQTPYTSFDASPLSLYAWSGDHVALLTPDSGLCAATVDDMLTAFDATYEFYMAATGRAP